MKLLLFGLFLYAGGSMAQSRVYDISIQGIDGKSISLASYQGKKILIAAVSADNLQKGQLRFLDSLQAGNPAVAVIAIPASDYKGANDSLVIDGVKKSSTLRMQVAAADGVKKTNGSKQNRLMQWLTSVSSNTHFDLDVTTDNQLYVISESGVLYAVLEKGAPASLINQLLKQEDVKQ
jgi:glutathione peroxidase-family protein